MEWKLNVVCNGTTFKTKVLYVNQKPKGGSVKTIKGTLDFFSGFHCQTFSLTHTNTLYFDDTNPKVKQRHPWRYLLDQHTEAHFGKKSRLRRGTGALFAPTQFSLWEAAQLWVRSHWGMKKKKNWEQLGQSQNHDMHPPPLQRQLWGKKGEREFRLSSPMGGLNGERAGGSEGHHACSVCQDRQGTLWHPRSKSQLRTSWRWAIKTWKSGEKK